MKRTFRLYSSIKSSYFDLISGDKETQQTKGLGLLLSKSETALKAFLEIKYIKSKIGEIDLNQIDRLLVNCELISSTENKYRADIVLRFYIDGKPFKVLLIEAKSINKGTSVHQTNQQIENYISTKAFVELEEFKKECYGITLTKLPSFTNHENLISITWSDIIQALYQVKPNKETLLDDYFNFLTNINGTMKFYEKEVFSIPTKDWSRQAIDNLKIYECPNRDRYIIKHKPLYMTFRKNGGGVMEKLYKVEDIIILNFNTDFDTFLKDENYDISYRNRVQGYANHLLENNIWSELPNDEKQVFILSENTIELRNRPRPMNGNNSFRAYYELADILNNELV
ncbi:hypothetical protein [Labilibaculum manganireducens]|uniref:hypothetical protein n=1 Tax=Labilibaculum manganireducens TaxID=1940525 RepID=UPI0029F55709|nr:hypothetical protein [Labilibaculum manganireducens]